MDDLRELRERANGATKPENVGDPYYELSNSEVLSLFAEIDRLAVVHREEQGRSADRLRAAVGRVSDLERALQAVLDGRPA